MRARIPPNGLLKPLTMSATSHCGHPDTWVIGERKLISTPIRDVWCSMLTRGRCFLGSQGIGDQGNHVER
jgi:hypothetical protein